MALKVCLEDKYTRSGISDEDREALSIAFDVCINWYDGYKSAFYRLAYDKKVSVRAVLAELEAVMALDSETSRPWMERCDKFRAFLLRQIEREKTEKAIETAMVHAVAAGIGWRDFYYMVGDRSERFPS